ncbi:MAG TPA: maleylpyruvate isomerase family mycothiol-dependent enzyme [Segeticoccus sp.]|uniref:maleylpyruvate isomerase family mycothiol-dependent enzyme n=1 Tax=Segeticoccus sp. TaxID=2706531 RepID=UPI002D7FB17E|nr:maleylpyruvate isomerase family mycothiol-dependent enzyme [Segeticoccus sp.]HET8599453.1 maleylpyruvate isomerase family mycothiol-dependent enzyme [Segeticoccus sp.]
MSVKQDWMRAARAFADLVDRLPAGRWESPSLGEWSLRELVGHTTSAGVREVISAVDHPAPNEDIKTPGGYYALAQSVDAGTYAAAVAASTYDARNTGQALGDAPASAVQDLVNRAVAKLEPVDVDALVTTAAGGMRLGGWLPTRTFELVVHCLDMATAAGVEDGVPDDLIAHAAALAASTAATIGYGRTLLLALTGRGDLPQHFSVLRPSQESRSGHEHAS